MCTHKSCSVVSDSLWPHGLWPTRLLCPWDSPGRSPEWTAVPISRASSQLRSWTWASRTAGGSFTARAAREAISVTRSLAPPHALSLHSVTAPQALFHGFDSFWFILDVQTGCKCKFLKFAYTLHPAASLRVHFPQDCSTMIRTRKSTSV